jgi:hypothetical protein
MGTLRTLRLAVVQRRSTQFDEDHQLPIASASGASKNVRTHELQHLTFRCGNVEVDFTQ